MSRSTPAGASSRDRIAQGAVLEYGERLDSTCFEFIHSAKHPKCTSTICVNFGKRYKLLEDRRVHRRFLNPSGIRPGWVLSDQCQGSVDTVEQVGSDKDEVSAGENIELDHSSRLYQGGGRGREQLPVGVMNAFILVDPHSLSASPG